MFLLTYNETTGENEIYCTECERFIDNICVDHCPTYEKEVKKDDQQGEI